MKLLNVGCGGQRPQDEYWWNLDMLRTQLKEGTPERTNLDAEPRYVECDVLSEDLPFPDEHFDGVLIQHVLEHMGCHDAVMVIEECKRVIKPDGVLVASVPDSDYFLYHYGQDTRENAVTLFGEPISEPEYDKFFDYALFHRDHVQLLTLSSLRCLLLKGGFTPYNIHLRVSGEEFYGAAAIEIFKQLNRMQFSAILCAYK